MRQTYSRGGFIVRVIEGIKMKDNLKCIKPMESERKAVNTVCFSKAQNILGL